MFEEIKLAYNTLSDADSRQKYDEYISQLQRVGNMKGKVEEEEDPEVIAERERRKKERGKKRFEEDYSFVNEEFFSSWQNRTNNHGQSFEEGAEQTIETMFDGKNLKADVKVSFAESMQEGGVTKNITVTREDICGSCKGTRERSGS